MKKIILAFLLCISASAAQAQTLGCFVSNTSNPYCSTQKVICDLRDPSRNYGLFGYTVGLMCQDFISAIILATDYETQRDAARADTNKCINDYNGLVARSNETLATLKQVGAQYNELVSSSQGISALNDRLRRVCGRKCKRIR